MNEMLARKITEFREMGIQYTFDGFAVSDLITQLDGVAEVLFIEFRVSRLTILIGKITGDPRDIIRLIPTAGLLNAMASGVEDSSDGSKLWFEWLMPKNMYYEKKV